MRGPPAGRSRCWLTASAKVLCIRSLTASACTWLAKLLPHHGIRYLARPKTFQARRARQALEPLIDLAGHALARHSHFQAPLESLASSSPIFALLLPSLVSLPSDRITMPFEPLVRKERLELSRVTPLAPKASASTIPPLSRPRNAHESSPEGTGNYTEDRHRPTCAGPSGRWSAWHSPTALKAALTQTGSQRIRPETPLCPD